MKKIKIISYNYIDKEIVDYFNTIDGIINVELNNKELIVKYNENMIGPKSIGTEYEIFMDYFLVNSFNKFYGGKTLEKEFTINNACCDYCLAPIMEKLFFNDNVDSVESITKEHESYYDYKVRIKYHDIDIEEVLKSIK